jgi:hypothetical protein
MYNTYCFYKATLVTRIHLSRTFLSALSVLFQLHDLSSFPAAQMLTHMTVVCGLCDLTTVNSVTTLQQAKSRFLHCPLSQSRISTIFFLDSENVRIQVFEAGDKKRPLFVYPVSGASTMLHVDR